MVFRARQRQVGKGRVGHILHKTPGSGHAVHRIVMEHHQTLILRELHIQLDAVARSGRRLKGGDAVLRDALVLREQPPVGVVAVLEGRAQRLVPQTGRHGEHHCRQRQQNQQNPHHHFHVPFGLLL